MVYGDAFRLHYLLLSVTMLASALEEFIDYFFILINVAHILYITRLFNKLWIYIKLWFSIWRIWKRAGPGQVARYENII